MTKRRNVREAQARAAEVSEERARVAAQCGRVHAPEKPSDGFQGLMVAKPGAVALPIRRSLRKMKMKIGALALSMIERQRRPAARLRRSAI